MHVEDFTDDNILYVIINTLCNLKIDKKYSNVLKKYKT